MCEKLQTLDKKFFTWWFERQVDKIGTLFSVRLVGSIGLAEFFLLMPISNVVIFSTIFSFSLAIEMK